MAGVEAAAVVPFTDTTGQMALAGFWSGDGSNATREAIREHLAKTLPAHMRPASLRHCEAIPLTPNGKIDRKALSVPGWDPEPVPVASPIFADDLQRSVAQIWERHLGRTEIVPASNFFDEGGHSLLVVLVVAEVECTLGVTIGLGTMFTSPTLAEFTESSATAPPTGRSNRDPAGEGRGDPRNPLFCILGIELYRPLAEALGEAQPVHAVYVEEEAQFVAEAGAGRRTQLPLDQIANAYVEAIKRTQPQGPYRLVGVSFGGVLALEMARRLEAEGEEVGLVVMIDTIRRDAQARLLAELLDEPRHEAAVMDCAGSATRSAIERCCRSARWRVRRQQTRRSGLRRLALRRGAAFFETTGELATDLRLRSPVLLVKAADKSSLGPGFCSSMTMAGVRCSAEPSKWTRIPGDHLSILTPPHVEALATRIAEAL